MKNVEEGNGNNHISTSVYKSCCHLINENHLNISFRKLLPLIQMKEEKERFILYRTVLYLPLPTRQ